MTLFNHKTRYLSLATLTTHLSVHVHVHGFHQMLTWLTKNIKWSLYFYYACSLYMYMFIHF